jgi:WD40 repeat protein
MTKVLVSYSRKDSATARKIIEAFKSINLDVWVDWEDIPPAVGWLDQILQGIEESDAFIFLISPDSVVSEVCNVEIGLAEKNHKRIIPIVVRDLDPKTVTPLIRDLNWIFIREQDNFEEGINKVKIAVEIDIEWLEEHRRLQVRALEWERKKEPSLLLRGRDLRNASTMLKSAENKDPKSTTLQQHYMQYSRRAERGRITLWITTVITLIVMIFLSITAIDQSNKASANAQRADEKAVLAAKNEKAATNARALAEKNKNIAEAQRSAARAQIYQSRSGELYTSTLLAIDSWGREPSQEAEDVLRKNISLLPIPVAQMAQFDRINSLVFSPSGDTFVTASVDNTACMWNVRDGTKLFCAASSGAVSDAVFSPDGEIIVTGDQSGEVLIMDAQSGKVQDKFDYGVPVWSVNISPDGKLLAAARDDGRISVINLKTRKLDYELQTYGRLNVSAFSPNGVWFAAGSSAGTVTLWDLINGAIISGPSHKSEVLTIEFSPDSNTLVSGGADSTAIVTQTRTGRELFRILNEDWVEDIAFSPDGSWFVTASDDNRIRVWDTFSGEERIRMLQDSFVSKVIVSSNGQWIATTGFDKTIRVWNAATGAEIFQIPLASNGTVLAFSKDENYLVSGEQKGNINIWDISGMSASTSYIQFHGLVGNAQFSPSADWLAASVEGQVWLLDKEQLSSRKTIPQGEPIFELDSNVRKLIISPDSKWIGISTDSGDAVLYKVDGSIKKTIAKSSFEQKIAFSMDGSRLIIGDFDGNLQAWDLDRGEMARPLMKSDSGVMSLAAGPGLLAVGLTDKIIILDIKTGQTISEIESPGDHQLTVFSPDGTLLAANNSSGQIYIWKQQDGKFELLHSIPSERAYSMIFDSTGAKLMVGVLNNVYMIDPLTGGEIARIPHKDTVNDISFSPDRKTLATASLKVIQFWDVAKIPVIDRDTLVASACARMFQNFDLAQWNSFFGDEPYRPLCDNLPQ